MLEVIEHWHDTVELIVEEKIQILSRRLQSFSPSDHRALSRRIKPGRLHQVACKLLEFVQAEAPEEEIQAVLVSANFPRGYFYSSWEMEKIMQEYSVQR